MVHFQLKGQLLEVRMACSPICRRYHETEKIAMHVLCECKGVAKLSPSPGNQLHGVYYYYSINGNNILLIDVKVRSLLNSSFCAILNQLPDNGQQIDHNM